MKLTELKKGDMAKIILINGVNLKLKRRLLDMGITSGVVVKIKRVAPLGDPISIELRGYELCLRKSDLSNIEVIKLWK